MPPKKKVDRRPSQVKVKVTAAKRLLDEDDIEVLEEIKPKVNKTPEVISKVNNNTNSNKKRKRLDSNENNASMTTVTKAKAKAAADDDAQVKAKKRKIVIKVNNKVEKTTPISSKNSSPKKEQISTPKIVGQKNSQSQKSAKNAGAKKLVLQPKDNKNCPQIVTSAAKNLPKQQQQISKEQQFQPKFSAGL